LSQIIEIADGAHSELGPSAAERWIPCMGSVIPSRNVPDNPSKYAIEGTAAHTVSEWVRRRQVPAATFKGILIRVNHAAGTSEVPCGTAMVNSVQAFCDKVSGQPGDELIEERVHYERYVPGGFGTLDSAKMQDRVLRVTDFKHGSGIKKDAKMNPQLLLYAVGTALRFSWLYRGFEKFILAICQPRRRHYDEWEIGATDLRAWVNDVARPAALRALQPNAPFKAGTWCRESFCRLRPTCRVYDQWNQEHGGRSKGDPESEFMDIEEEQ
jgi:hypothetical protein